MSPTTTQKTIYGFPNGTSSEPSPQEAALNALIPRFDNTDEPPFPTIEGTPQIPVMSLHQTGDLFVPLLNEVVYAQEVADNGLSDNLVQRTIRAPGHWRLLRRRARYRFRRPGHVDRYRTTSSG